MKKQEKQEDEDDDDNDEVRLQSRDKINEIIDMFVRKSKGLISSQFVKRRIFVCNLLLNDQFWSRNGQ